MRLFDILGTPMTDFSKILIANRGEIAIRIMRAATELDMRTAYVKQFDVKLTDLAATVKTFETIKLNMQEKLLQAKEELDDVKVLCWPYPFYCIRL